jgi:hypothetical protein
LQNRTGAQKLAQVAAKGRCTVEDAIAAPGDRGKCRVGFNQLALRALQAMDRYLPEMLMKVLLTMAFMLFASNVFADCVTNRLGKTVCSNGQSAVAVNPNTGTVATAEKSPSGVTTAQTNTGAKAAYNPHTGNAAVQQTNQNGVKTTQTTAGGHAKIKNGMGVATGPNGTTCAKGVNNQGCKK